MLAHRGDSLVVLVDLQPSFLNPINEAERIVQRCKFLLEMAKLLQVPILATEQYPSRMGGTDETLATLLQAANARPISKMCFSCAGSDEFNQAIAKSGAQQVIISGIETHICVSQTAHDLLAQGKTLFIAADAVGARSEQMHELGLRRMEGAGAIIAHSEAIAYEWLRSAENAAFKDALQIVKRFA